MVGNHQASVHPIRMFPGVGLSDESTAVFLDGRRVGETSNGCRREPPVPARGDVVPIKEYIGSHLPTTVVLDL